MTHKANVSSNTRHILFGINSWGIWKKCERGVTPSSYSVGQTNLRFVLVGVVWDVYNGEHVEKNEF